MVTTTALRPEVLTALRALYRHDHHARVFIDAVALMKKADVSLEVLPVDVIEKATKIARQDVIEMAKHFQDAQAGKLIVGRSGHPTRIQWYYPLAEMAKKAMTIPKPGEPEFPASIPSPERLRAGSETDFDDFRSFLARKLNIKPNRIQVSISE